MAGPVASKVQLADDSANTGKKMRTQTKSIGGETVHEHFVIAGRQAVLLGRYRLAMAQVVILASAQNGTSTGFLWFHNPSANSNKKMRIRHIWVHSQHASALATPTAPRLVCTRMTFTGTASGASVTPVKTDTGDGSSVADLRTAVTGLTVSLVGAIGSAGICGAVTAVGAYAPVPIDMLYADGQEDMWPVFAPGEGFVIYQDVNGTTSDTRVANIVIEWDEVDTA